MEYQWNNSRRHNLYYQSGDYDQAKQLYSVLHKPYFTLKKFEHIIDDISYRRINLWCSEGLVSDSRESNDIGWRRFSYTDILKLLTITDLRKLDIPIDDIKAIIDKISNTTFTQSIKPTTVRVLELEYYYLQANGGKKISLLIDFRQVPLIIFGTESKTVVDYMATRQGNSPLLILPFFSYVAKIASLSNQIIPINKKTAMGDVVLKRHSALSPKEQKIIDIIRNKTYEKIAIVKRDGDNFTIRAKSHRRGTFSDEDVVKIINDKAFQTVAVSMVNGRKITIEREETIKV